MRGDGRCAGASNVGAPGFEVEPDRPSAVAFAEAAVEAGCPVVGTERGARADPVDAEDATIDVVLVPCLAQERGLHRGTAVVRPDAFEHVGYTAAVLDGVEVQLVAQMGSAAAAGTRVHGDQLGDAGVAQSAVQGPVFGHADARLIAPEYPDHVGLCPVARAQCLADGVVCVFRERTAEVARPEGNEVRGHVLGGQVVQHVVDVSPVGVVGSVETDFAIVLRGPAFRIEERHVAVGVDPGLALLAFEVPAGGAVIEGPRGGHELHRREPLVGADVDVLLGVRQVQRGE